MWTQPHFLRYLQLYQSNTFGWQERKNALDAKSERAFATKIVHNNKSRKNSVSGRPVCLHNQCFTLRIQSKHLDRINFVRSQGRNKVRPKGRNVRNKKSLQAQTKTQDFCQQATAMTRVTKFVRELKWGHWRRRQNFSSFNGAWFLYLWGKQACHVIIFTTHSSNTSQRVVQKCSTVSQC